MKTKFIALSALAVAALALFSCAKTEVDFTTEEPIVKEKTGIPFDLTVSTVETKTVNDDDATTWAAYDAITLFHAVTGSTTYVYDDAFTANEAGASVKFSGTLGAELDGGTNYDWYAIYPAVDDLNNTPAEYSYVTIGSVAGENQIQAGNDSKAHLAGSYFPLYGKKSNLAAATKPALSMKQMASVLAVKVANRIPEDIVVTNVTVTCSGISDGLVGEYKVDITGETPAYTKSTVNNTAKLSVTSGDALATGETGTFYLAVKPFTAAAGQKITIVVTTNQGTQTSVSNALGADFSFQAGKIHDLNFNFTNKALSAVEFKYNDSDWITAQGLTAPATDKAATYLAGTTQTVSPITISSFTDGTTGSRIYNGSGKLTLRVYASGGSFTVSSTGSNLISKIAMTGSGFGDDAVNATAALGTISGDSKNIIWNGLSQDVTFIAAGNLTIETITVFYRVSSDSDHVVSLPVKTKGVAYNATSTTLSLKKVNVDDLIITSASEGYVSNSHDGSILTVNMTANASSSPRDIVVNVASASAGFDEDITITQDGAPTKINTLTASSTGVTVNAQVTALTTKGFIITDDTASILVYTNSDVTSTYTIGQSVTVSGNVSVNNLGLQFNASGSDATVTPGAAGSYDYPAATAYSLSDVTTYIADDSNRLATYVQYSGVIPSSPSSYVNVCVGGVATANTGSYNIWSDLSTGLSKGDYVTIKGYAISVSGGRMNVCVTSITKDDSVPALVYNNITGVSGEGVGTTNLTITPYRVSGWTPELVSKPSWVSSATPAADCTKLTYEVDENGTTERSGDIVIRLTKDLTTYVYTIKITQDANLPKTKFTFSTIYKDCTTNCNISTDSQDGITLTYNKNTGTQPKYYNTGTAIRLYNLNTLVVSGGTKKIKKVVFTFGSDKGDWSVSSGGGTLTGSGTATMTWTASSDVTSVTFGNAATARINTITVTYQE